MDKEEIEESGKKRVRWLVPSRTCLLNCRTGIEWVIFDVYARYHVGKGSRWCYVPSHVSDVRNLIISR